MKPKDKIKGSWKKELWEFLAEGWGLTGTTCFVFSLMILWIANWRDNPLEVMLGIISMLYCMGRMYSYFEFKELKEMLEKINETKR